jgi:hypothetical protein
MHSIGERADGCLLTRSSRASRAISFTSSGFAAPLSRADPTAPKYAAVTASCRRTTVKKLLLLLVLVALGAVIAKKVRDA